MFSDILKLVWSDPKKSEDDKKDNSGPSYPKRGPPNDIGDTDRDVAAYEQKAKRLKLDPNPSNHPSYCLPTDMEVFQAAKEKDTIAVFYDAQAMNYVLGLWCVWASQRSTSRGTGKQLTIVLVESDDIVGKLCDTLQYLQPKLNIGKILDLEDSWKDTEWLAVMNKDVAVMSGHTFLHYYQSEAIVFHQIGVLVFQQPDLAMQLDSPMSEIALALAETIEEEKPRIIGTFLQRPDDPETRYVHVETERVLRARLFGKDTHAVTSPLGKKPKELIIRFGPPKKVVDTALCKHLRTFSKSEVYFRPEFRSAKIVLREVGSFASDWVWRRALKNMDKELDSPLYEVDNSVDSPEKQEINTRRNVYKSIKNWTFTIPNLDIGSRGFNVSPKIASLVQILQCFQKDAEKFRGIVLVRRRITALAIVEVLRTVSGHLPFIRAEALTGPWAHDNISQLSILKDFIVGKCNLLVATKIAEDGVEVPPCSCIIRYDIFDSSISYAHTCALANGPECHLVFMLDPNSDAGRRTVRHLAKMPEDLKHWTQLAATRETGAYPPANMLQTADYYHSDSEEDVNFRSEYIKDPTMSGKIYADDAVNVVYRYFSSLPSASRPTITSRAIFRFTSSSPSVHVCTIIFPSGSPFSTVEGPPSASTIAAKRAACFKACKQLHALGLLPYQLFPRPKEVARRLRPVAVFIDEEVEQTKGDILPTLPPAPLPPSHVPSGEDGTNIPTVVPEATSKAQLASGTRCYKRKAPEFWKNILEVKHNTYYPTIITVDRNSNPSKPYRPILFITRNPLPVIEEIKLHFAATHSLTYLRPGHPLQFDDQKLSLLHRYTLRAMRAIMNKPLNCAMEEMPYFLAPLDFAWDIETGKAQSRWPYPDVSDYIPWDLVIYAAEQHLVPLRTESLESLEEDIKDAVVQDWWTEFTKRYDCMRLRRDLNPLTPLDDLAKAKIPANLVEVCKAKRKGFEGLVDYSQPLIEVSNLPGITNRLSPVVKTFTPASNGSLYSAKFVIPELCSKFTIPASTMRTLSLIPSIMKRVDDTLLVRELNAMYFYNEIDPSALQAAITAPSAGLETDYERLELLGDAYLKYLSSIYLFVTNPTKHEGILHIARQKIISNKALLVNADKSGLPQYIQSRPFLPKMWLPRGYSVIKPETKAQTPNTELKDVESKEKDEGSSMEVTEQLEIARKDPADDGLEMIANENDLAPSKAKRPYYDDHHQWLGDKCVADVAEAIIGAAYQTGGPGLGLKIVKLLHIPLPFIDSWEDFALKAKNPPPDITDPLEDNVLESVESIVGAKFRLPHILAQALTHTSIRGNDMTCYERLEFLGDAILDFLVIRHIFDLHGRLSPGALTLLKGAMVSNSVLAAISVHYGLHRYLRIDSQSVKNAINQYIPEIEEKRRAEFAAAKEEERPCGQYWLEVEPPKSIADVVESIMGALYVSDGFDLKGVQRMYDTMLRPFYDQHISLKTLSHHPTKILFELFQSQGCQEFQIAKYLHSEGQNLVRCEVEVHNVILTVGIDASPVLAARKASLEALDALEGDPAFMSRVCDCRAKAEQRKAAKRSARTQSGKAETKLPESDEEDLEL